MRWLLLLLVCNIAQAQQATARLSANYVEDRLYRLMTQIAETRYDMACRRTSENNYCFSLSQAIARQSASNRRELVLNYIDRIFPSTRFSAECRANVDHVFELLDDHPWPAISCESEDAYCPNTLEFAFGTNKPEVIEGALITRLETCYYNGPSTLPF